MSYLSTNSAFFNSKMFDRNQAPPLKRKLWPNQLTKMQLFIYKLRPNFKRLFTKVQAIFSCIISFYYLENKQSKHKTQSVVWMHSKRIYHICDLAQNKSIVKITVELYFYIPSLWSLQYVMCAIRANNFQLDTQWPN